MPFARRALPGRAVALVHLGAWEEGLLVAPGNPRGLRGVEDLPGLRLVRREPGSGARQVLDHALREAGIPDEALGEAGDPALSHWEVARAVLRGAADAGVSTGAVAAAYGLDFLPLRRVHYDLAIPQEYLAYEPVRRLLGTLDHRWVRRQLRSVGGFDTSHTGEVVAELPASDDPEAACGDS